MIKGQWYFRIDDQFKPDYLIYFKLVEKANMGLPAFELEFQSPDVELVHRFCQRSYTFTVQIGKDSPEETYNLITLSRGAANLADTRRIKLAGFINATNYLYKQDYQSWEEPKPSTEVVSYYASFSNLTPKILSESDDKMHWINPGWTPRRFLQHVYEYSYFPSGPSVFAVNRFKELIFGSVKDLPFGGIISNKPEVADILINNVAYTNDEGFLSGWAPETLKAPRYYIEERILDVQQGNLYPLFSTSLGVHYQPKETEYFYQNDNVHKNWIKAYLTNRQFHASLMSFRVKIITIDFPLVKLLNRYELQWYEQESQELNPYISGEYIATDVVTIIQHQHIQQQITLSRESVNVL